MNINVVTKESFYIEDGRLYEILSRAYSMAAKNQDSWASLFKTKAYKRRTDHIVSLFTHAHYILKKYIEENNLDWKDYEVKRCGSDKLTDVIYKRNQNYEVVKVE